MARAPGLTAVDWTTTPPVVEVPRRYNACVDLLDRNLEAGRADALAFVDDAGRCSYGELAERAARAGHALRSLGLREEERVLMVMRDGIDFVALFLGAIRAGIVPVPVNTLLTSEDYAFLLRDSRARALFVSAPLHASLQGALAEQPHLRHVVAVGGAVEGCEDFAELTASQPSELAPADTVADEPCFWLYSSGSTGRLKGAIHLHSDPVHTAVLYGQGVLGVHETDVVFSAAKLFFAYGLGNALTFPMYAGASAVLMAERPTPRAVMALLKERRPTIFYGVPTLYAGILADAGCDRDAGSDRLRACVSAGEALPADVARRWVERFGVDILDGLGSTEMLHIFLSNRPGEIRYGTTGKPVPGYEVRLTGEDGGPAAVGEIGDLWVSGPSAALAYWNDRARSLETFLGPWTRTGDKYVADADGYYTYAGRSDDLLKVGGIWVLPFEVESTLVAHPAVVEAAVVGREDGDGLTKPAAFVVLAEGHAPGRDLAEALKQHVKARLAPYKYPRWIEFVEELPKTATGKTQRFKLRR